MNRMNYNSKSKVQFQFTNEEPTEKTSNRKQLFSLILILLKTRQNFACGLQFVHRKLFLVFSASLCLAFEKNKTKKSRQHLECSRQLYKRNQPGKIFFVYDRADAVRGSLLILCAGGQTRNLCLCKHHSIPQSF